MTCLKLKCGQEIQSPLQTSQLYQLINKLQNTSAPFCSKQQYNRTPHGSICSLFFRLSFQNFQEARNSVRDERSDFVPGWSSVNDVIQNYNYSLLNKDQIYNKVQVQINRLKLLRWLGRFVLITWGKYNIQIVDKFKWFRCKHYQIVAGNVHSPPIFATNNIKESRNFILQIEKYFCQDYRECTGGIEVSPQEHSLIQTLREVKHLEDFSFIFTVYKQNFGKQQFHLIILEAEETEHGGGDVILLQCPRTQ
ncbi:Hypothetical_protein [Hexamita inflata]|uniref:Hypothetical_protein n=1 Tax=Hexamita inflata TaxID=28002 RepID=A0ABP1HUZ8_9EUKA